MAFDNPFKQLDKKNFRDSKSPAHKHTQAQKTVKPLAKQKTIANDDDSWLANDLESENELFLQSMSKNTKVFTKDTVPSKEEQLQNAIQNNSINKPSSKISKQQTKTKQEEKHNSFQNSLTLPDALKNKVTSTSKLGEIEEEKQKAILQTTKIAQEKEMDFFTAMQDVKPLAGTERIAPPEPEQIIHQNDRSHLIYDFEEGNLEFALTYTEDLIQCNILGLDILILAQLQQRHYNPEAHLDLHGLYAYQAYLALLGFFKNAYYKDMRCVLIVTGKGLNSHDRVAVLRSKVAHWLIDSPFKHLILAFCTAQPQDGGNGAMYVLLRKRKKNARQINWEQMPNDYDLWADLDK